MTGRFWAVLAGVLAVAAVAIGCGSDEQTDATSGAAPLSKVAFVKQADDACRRLLAQGRAAMADWTGSKKNAEGTTVNAAGESAGDINRAYYEAKAQALRQLTPPAADQEQFEAMLDALEKAIEEGDRKPAVFVSGSKSLGDMAQISAELGLECSI